MDKTRGKENIEVLLGRTTIKILFLIFRLRLLRRILNSNLYNFVNKPLVILVGFVYVI